MIFHSIDVLTDGSEYTGTSTCVGSGGTVFLSIWKQKDDVSSQPPPTDPNGIINVNSSSSGISFDLLDGSNNDNNITLLARYCISGLGDLIGRAACDQRYKLNQTFRCLFGCCTTQSSSLLYCLQGLPALLHLLHQGGVKEFTIVSMFDSNRIEQLINIIHPSRQQHQHHPLVHVCQIPTTTDATKKKQQLEWWKVYEDEFIIVHATTTTTTPLLSMDVMYLYTFRYLLENGDNEQRAATVNQKKNSMLVVPSSLVMFPTQVDQFITQIVQMLPMIDVVSSCRNRNGNASQLQQKLSLFAILSLSGKEGDSSTMYSIPNENDIHTKDTSSIFCNNNSGETEIDSSSSESESSSGSDGCDDDNDDEKAKEECPISRGTSNGSLTIDLFTVGPMRHRQQQHQDERPTLPGYGYHEMIDHRLLVRAQKQVSNIRQHTTTTVSLGEIQSSFPWSSHTQNIDATDPLFVAANNYRRNNNEQHRTIGTGYSLVYLMTKQSTQSFIVDRIQQRIQADQENGLANAKNKNSTTKDKRTDCLLYLEQMKEFLSPPTSNHVVVAGPKPIHNTNTKNDVQVSLLHTNNNNHEGNEYVDDENEIVLDDDDDNDDSITNNNNMLGNCLPQLLDTENVSQHQDICTELLVLGTGCASPSPHRGSSGYALIFGLKSTGTNKIHPSPFIPDPVAKKATATATTQRPSAVDEIVVVFEAGEGFCTQWNRHSKRRHFASIQAIWISHAHWDHYGGLVNLLHCIHRDNLMKKSTCSDDHKSCSLRDASEFSKNEFTLKNKTAISSEPPSKKQRHRRDYNDEDYLAVPWLVAPRKVFDYLNLMLDDPSIYYRPVHHDNQLAVSQVMTNLYFRTELIKIDETVVSTVRNDMPKRVCPIQYWENVRVDHSCYQAFGFVMGVRRQYKYRDNCNPTQLSLPLVFCFSGDTRPCRNLVQTYQRVRGRYCDRNHLSTATTTTNFMVHEATYDDNEHEMSIRKKHSTIKDALMVASDVGASKVLLTHFSQRYDTMMPLFDSIKKCSIPSDQMIVGCAIDGLLLEL